MKYEIGIVGLGVMGRSLGLNLARNGFRVAGHDLDPARVQAFEADPRAERERLRGVESLLELVQVLERPRRILLLVPAGSAVDDALGRLLPQLEPGDLVIDGGNSHFADTERRSTDLEARGLLFLGTGISGGEKGALLGPSLMPGGHQQGWELVEPMLRAIAARADDGEPCVGYLGPRGAGHYVKMVHNGVEYADLQLLSEIYHLLGQGLGLPAPELAQVFAAWNATELGSYLVEITARVLAERDPETARPLVDLVLDEAEQKGTGRWTSQTALELGVPVPSITLAVDSRHLSARRAERLRASRVLPGPGGRHAGSRADLIEAARDALYAAKITVYAQGFSLLQEGSRSYGYALDLERIAGLWRAGCIIRARLLEEVRRAYRREPGLPNLLLDPELAERVSRRQQAWRQVLAAGIELGIPMLALGSALGYFDAYRSGRLPASLIQLQRDFFGAHGYRRIDREGSFHHQWEPKEGEG